VSGEFTLEIRGTGNLPLFGRELRRGRRKVEMQVDEQGRANFLKTTAVTAHQSAAFTGNENDDPDFRRRLPEHHKQRRGWKS